MLTLAIFSVLLLLLMIDVPIAVAIGFTAVAFFVAQGQTSFLAMLPQRMYSGTTGFTLLAIPFFILAGNLMNIAGVTSRIYRFALALVGWMKGGLAQVNIIGSVIFSGMSGTALADAAGIGTIEIKAMKDHGYPVDAAVGVTAASGGNHGAAVAYASACLGHPARIFVPTVSSPVKIARIRAYGADVVVAGDRYADAALLSEQWARESGALVVHPYDSPFTIAGQGTVAPEIVDQIGLAPDVLLVPVGGGGLLAGCLAWIRERWPATRVIGVEPAGAASMQAALWAGHPVRLDRLDTFADGVAVRTAGTLTLPIIQQKGCEWATVAEGQICSEMLDLYQTDGVITEPAGALASAALRTQVSVEPGQTVVAIVSGGNNDVSRYAEIVERSLIFEGRKHYFLVQFPQEPGALRRFLDEVLGPDDDITLFEYVKRSNREVGPALVGVELGDPGSLDELLRRMEHSQLQVEVIDPESPFYRFLV